MRKRWRGAEEWRWRWRRAEEWHRRARRRDMEERGSARFLQRGRLGASAWRRGRLGEAATSRRGQWWLAGRGGERVTVERLDGLEAATAAGGMEKGSGDASREKQRAVAADLNSGAG
jgi:hypothetical protein